MSYICDFRFVFEARIDPDSDSNWLYKELYSDFWTNGFLYHPTPNWMAIPELRKDAENAMMKSDLYSEITESIIQKIVEEIERQNPNVAMPWPSPTFYEVIGKLRLQSYYDEDGGGSYIDCYDIEHRVLEYNPVDESHKELIVSKQVCFNVDDLYQPDPPERVYTAKERNIHLQMIFDANREIERLTKENEEMAYDLKIYRHEEPLRCRISGK